MQSLVALEVDRHRGNGKHKGREVEEGVLKILLTAQVLGDGILVLVGASLALAVAQADIEELVVVDMAVLVQSRESVEVQGDKTALKLELES